MPSASCLYSVHTGFVRLRHNRGAQHKGYLHFLTEYIGLYTFGIGAIILSILELSARIQCSPLVKKLADSDNYNLTKNLTDGLNSIVFEYNVFTSLSVFKSLCILLQVGVSVSFHM